MGLEPIIFNARYLSKQTVQIILFCFIIAFLRVSHTPGWPLTHSEAEHDLELPTLLPQPPKGWVLKCAPHLASISHLQASWEVTVSSSAL